MNYNTIRKPLILPEYGRNIHEMIEHTVTIENEQERNNAAKEIITIMGQKNPHLRDVEEFTHMLWDHLFIMSEFKLKVDSPYPIPEMKVESKPERMPYSSNNLKYKFYGRTIPSIIKKAIDLEEGEEKTALIETIANLMKKFYLNWNRDSVDDEVIYQQLEELSEGQLKLKKDFVLDSTNDLLQSKKRKNNYRNPKHSNNSKHRNKKRHYN